LGRGYHIRGSIIYSVSQGKGSNINKNCVTFKYNLFCKFVKKMKENGVMLMWVDRVGVYFNNAFISINNLVILINDPNNIHIFKFFLRTFERRYNLC